MTYITLSTSFRTSSINKLFPKLAYYNKYPNIWLFLGSFHKFYLFNVHATHIKGILNFLFDILIVSFLHKENNFGYPQYYCCYVFSGLFSPESLFLMLPLHRGTFDLVGGSQWKWAWAALHFPRTRYCASGVVPLTDSWELSAAPILWVWWTETLRLREFSWQN